jgi:hypothetical protein
VREGRDGAEDLLRPPDEARLTRRRRLFAAVSDGGEGVLNCRVELTWTHGLEKTLADLEHLEPTVFLVA